MTSQAGTDEAVARVVDMLRARDRITKSELAQATGIPLRTLSRRLNGGGHWEWREVAQLASYFNVPMAVFHAGPSALIAGTDREGRFTWTVRPERRAAVGAWAQHDRRGVLADA